MALEKSWFKISKDILSSDRKEAMKLSTRFFFTKTENVESLLDIYTTAKNCATSNAYIGITVGQHDIQNQDR